MSAMFLEYTRGPRPACATPAARHEVHVRYKSHESFDRVPPRNLPAIRFRRLSLPGALATQTRTDS